MRLRFAPSPTGSLHLGNARTAILNWLCARRAGGTLVLRIEDTDRRRNTPRAEVDLLGDLRWLGLDWDEGPDIGGAHGPYRQSERGDRYRELLERLLDGQAAYRCFCEAGAGGGDAGPGCTGDCREVSPDEGAERARGGEAAAVRLRVSEGRPWPVVRDGLRGEVVSGEPAHDFVLARSDGSPLYAFVVVVDDHDMRIDHVVRGQDHLSNTGRQLLVYRAFGWEPPRFTHLPLVLGEDRSRLSKRDGAVSVAEMRGMGVLPEALMNYLVLLGWAPPDEREVLTPRELIEAWRLEDIAPTNVVFDRDKLEWIDQQHLARLEPAELLVRLTGRLREEGLEPARTGAAREWWLEAVDLVRGAAGGLAGFAEQLRPLFEPARADWRPDGDERLLLQRLRAASRARELDDPERFRERVRELGAECGLRGRSLFHPIRVVLTGQDSGPELARLVPLIERGADLELTPPVPSVAARIDTLLGGA